MNVFSLTKFYDIQESPLPSSGVKVLVNVVTSAGRDEPVSFISCVRTDEMGLMDDQGDHFMYSEDVTHWANFPDSFLRHT